MRDYEPSRGSVILEQAVLPSMTTNDARTAVIARYTMLQDVGHALGALVPSLCTGIARSSGARSGAPGLAAELTIGSVAALGLISLLLYGALDRAHATTDDRARAGISPRSRGILVKICALFPIDSLAGGFLTTALLSYFFFERFGVGPTVIGPLFFAARLMNAVSHLGAAWFAKRIGLVNTMVFTHIPSSQLLATVAFAPNFPVAVVLFLFREGLVEMDVPTRQSYVLAVVESSERTFASGMTNRRFT